jgi:hypothetical protein
VNLKPIVAYFLNLDARINQSKSLLKMTMTETLLAKVLEDYRVFERVGRVVIKN